jgi:hypothetical protein
MERKMDNTDCARRLENYQHFVEQISQALGVPGDSLILPYAQSLRAELAAVTAERDALRAKVDGIEVEPDDVAFERQLMREAQAEAFVDDHLTAPWTADLYR